MTDPTLPQVAAFPSEPFPVVGGGWSRVVAPVLGLILVTAAAAKAFGGVHHPGGQEALLSPPARVLAIEVELLLGAWLISGWRARSARGVALGVFLFLACVSLHLALQGQSSCGCFGRVPVHPWATLAVDLSAVAVLALVRPTADGRPLTPVLGEFARLLAGGAALSAVMLLCLMTAWRAGPEAVLTRLRRESLAVKPETVELGTGTRDRRQPFELSLTNHSSRPVTLIGGSDVRSYALADALPATIPAGHTLTLTASAKFAGSAGRFWQDLTLYTDDPSQPAVTVRLVGTTAEPSLGGD